MQSMRDTSTLEGLLKYFVRERRYYQTMLAKEDRKEGRSYDVRRKSYVNRIEHYEGKIESMRRRIKRREYKRALQAGPWC